MEYYKVTHFAWHYSLCQSTHWLGTLDQLKDTTSRITAIINQQTACMLTISKHTLIRYGGGGAKGVDQEGLKLKSDTKSR